MPSRLFRCDSKVRPKRGQGIADEHNLAIVKDGLVRQRVVDFGHKGLLRSRQQGRKRRCHGRQRGRQVLLPNIGAHETRRDGVAVREAGRVGQHIGKRGRCVWQVVVPDPVDQACTGGQGARVWGDGVALSGAVSDRGAGQQRGWSGEN